MLNIYKTENEKIVQISEIGPNVWIDLVNPDIEEIKRVAKEAEVDEDLLMKLNDDDELPRIEVGKLSTLIVIDTPYLVDSAYKNKYYTYPLGIIIAKDAFITISLKELSIFNDFKSGKIKNFHTSKKTRFTLQILLRIASIYQKDLRVIDEDINNKEKYLRKSTKNKELLDLLNIEKTLVYFINSLKDNDIVLERLSKGNIVSLYDEDQDILDDAIIENKQSIEMANIYREILTSMTDTYATIISNNLNVIMKFLAGITIVFSVPTTISSFLGMNIPLDYIDKSRYTFPVVIVISLIISLIVARVLKKRDML